MKVRAVFDSDRGLRVEITAMSEQEQRVMGLILDSKPRGSLQAPKASFPVGVHVVFAGHHTGGNIERIELTQAGPATLEE